MKSKNTEDRKRFKLSLDYLHNERRYSYQYMADCLTAAGKLMDPPINKVRKEQVYRWHIHRGPHSPELTQLVIDWAHDMSRKSCFWVEFRELVQEHTKDYNNNSAARFMKNEGFSTPEIAEIAGCDTRTVAGWIKGKKPKKTRRSTFRYDNLVYTLEDAVMLPNNRLPRIVAGATGKDKEFLDAVDQLCKKYPDITQGGLDEAMKRWGFSFPEIEKRREALKLKTKQP